MHEDHLAWQVRAALRAGKWSQVLSATGAMGEAQRNDPAWVYCRARALLSQTNTEGSRAPALLEWRGCLPLAFSSVPTEGSVRRKSIERGRAPI